LQLTPLPEHDAVLQYYMGRLLILIVVLSIDPLTSGGAAPSKSFTRSDCATTFLEGQCWQWCHDLPDGLFDGGVWRYQTKTCRCFADFSPGEMGAMKLSPKIKKENGDNTTL
jgi:hypothetical protein